MIGLIELFRRKDEFKKEQEEKRYFSDILVNEPPDSEWRENLKILDYTSNPHNLLLDMKSFKENPIIKVCGKVAGLDIRLVEKRLFDEYSTQSLSYDGIIVLDVDFPLYFHASRSQKEISDLLFEKVMLESAKSFPIFMTGRLLKEKVNGLGKTIPCHLQPYVLEMGDYISPKPKKRQ